MTASTYYYDRLQAKPDTSRGVPVGVGDWRLVIEALLPAEGAAMWGIGEWDTAEWGELEWYDLTPYVRGLEWSRGADEYLGRPRVGTATITLDNTNERWSPWNTSPPVASVAYFSPGTLLRCGVVSALDTRAGGWLPQFTVITDSWSQSYAGLRGDSWIDVTGVETLRDLAGIDDNALPGVVGGGEYIDARIARLLDAADWPYGLVVDATTAPTVHTAGWTLQSTDMAANRLSECYQTVDSGALIFRSTRKGEAMIEGRTRSATAANPAVRPLVAFSASTFPPLARIYFHPVYPHDFAPPTTTVNYNPDSAVTLTDDAHIVNDARFARIGSTIRSYINRGSIARYGRRTLPRQDLLNTADQYVDILARAAVDTRGLSSLRISSLTVSTSDRGDAVYLAMMAADISDSCSFWNSVGYDHLSGYIERINHRVTPRNTAGVTWETDIGIATQDIIGLPGAQLFSEAP